MIKVFSYEEMEQSGLPMDILEEMRRFSYARYDSFEDFDCASLEILDFEDLLLSKEEQILQSLPEKDYKGYSASYIQFLFKHLPDMTKYQVTVDEQTGESVNDAMYQVTEMVEERLNVSLSTVAYADNAEMTADITTAITAGDDFCDAFFAHSAASFLVSGSLMNLSEISSFHFDNPWWNQGVMDSANLTEDVYLAYGSLSTTQYAFYVPTFFNVTLAENACLPDLYQIVRDGTWTLDKMDE